MANTSLAAVDHESLRIVRQFSRYGADCSSSDSIYRDARGQHWHDATAGMDLVGPFDGEGDAFHAARKWAGQPVTDGPSEFEYHKHGG
jgi:hypothetical protein